MPTFPAIQRPASFWLLFTFLALAVGSQAVAAVSADPLGTGSYDDYEKPEVCGSCHLDFMMQWRQAMMSQAYTHHWDEIEYFELAVPHAERDAKVADVKAGCNGCHAPLAYIAGDVPPPPPAAGSRANESVSCDFCHTITGFRGETPHNFNWIAQPGRTKYGPKPGRESPHHLTQASTFIQTADFCGTCHNEKSPYGIWVKSTHLEWREGPYGAEGVPCQRCHAPRAIGETARMADPALVAQHLFHGAHDPGKLAGAVELRVHPRQREVELDEPVELRAELVSDYETLSLSHTFLMRRNVRSVVEGTYDREREALRAADAAVTRNAIVLLNLIMCIIYPRFLPLFSSWDRPVFSGIVLELGRRGGGPRVADILRNPGSW